MKNFSTATLAKISEYLFNRQSRSAKGKSLLTHNEIKRLVRLNAEDRDIRKAIKYYRNLTPRQMLSFAQAQFTISGDQLHPFGFAANYVCQITCLRCIIGTS